MTLFDFARNNISRDRRNYIYYFVNCVFSVFVFFLFTVLSFHPSMSIVDRNSTMGLILIVGERISIGFSVCFISYSVGCFLKARSRQFGLITILGASKKQVNKLVFLENMIVGFASIVTGILLGFVFSKFFLDIANKVIGVSDFTFYFPVQAIITTVIVLGIVFLAIAFFTPRLIRKKEVVRLLKTEVTGEKPQKLLPLLIVFIVLFGFMIWLFTSGTQIAKEIQDNSVTALVLVFTIIIGTYLMFAYGMRMALALSKNSRARGRLLYSSDKKAKLRANAQTMTISAVLYAISFFSIILLFSMSTNVKTETEKIMPYAISYNAWTENADVAGDVAVIEEELKDLPGYQKTVFNLWYNKANPTRSAIMSVSDYNMIMKFLGRETVTVSENDVFLVAGNAGETVKKIPSDIQSFMDENRFDLSVEGYSEATITLSGFTNSVCVVNDSVFDTLKPQMDSKTITAFVYDNWEMNSHSPEAIESALKTSTENLDANVIIAYNYYRTSQLQNNLTLYIGSILCFTFILAVASFIYSRLYSELDAECKKYKGIVKIGLSKKELSSALRKVTSLILLIPFLVALIYLWIGIFISEQFAIVSNIPVAFWCTVVLLVLQTGIYFGIDASYRKAVFRKVYQDYERS
ncbi:TPA: FtsX-like permease family protein [Streptococcus suis]